VTVRTVAVTERTLPSLDLLSDVEEKMDLARSGRPRMLAKTTGENDPVPRATKLGSLGYAVT
jgi:hypothetical protein